MRFMAAKKTSSKKASPLLHKQKKDIIVKSSQTQSVKDTTIHKTINKRSAMIGIVVIALVLSLAFAGKSFLIAAIVNGQPIYRYQVVQQLEAKGGKQALNTMVIKTLIMQEAQKKNILVSENEIDAQIKDIEKSLSASGQSLGSALAAQGQTKEDLREQIMVQKIAEKMFAKDMVVSEAEAKKYVETNPTLFAQEKTEEAKVLGAKTQLSQQKLAEKFQAWVQKLQQNAKVTQFVNY